MQKAGVDLVQIQPFLVLISFLNHVILLLASIFHAQFSQEIKEDLYQNNVNLNQACVAGGFLLFCMFFCGSSSRTKPRKTAQNLNRGRKRNLSSAFVWL